MNDQKIDLKYVLSVIIAVLFTWLIHEFAHWLMSEMLGYSSTMSLNSTNYYDDENPTSFHKMIVSAAGPAITILQALVVFLLLKLKRWNIFLYPFLFVAFYMRALAGIMNLINLNDEGRIGVYLELGVYTLPIIVCSLLFYMVYKISKKYELGIKFQMLTLLLTMLASSVLIMANQFFKIVLIPNQL